MNHELPKVNSFLASSVTDVKSPWLDDGELGQCFVRQRNLPCRPTAGRCGSVNVGVQQTRLHRARAPRRRELYHGADGCEEKQVDERCSESGGNTGFRSEGAESRIDDGENGSVLLYQATCHVMIVLYPRDVTSGSRPNATRLLAPDLDTSRPNNVNAFGYSYVAGILPI